MLVGRAGEAKRVQVKGSAVSSTTLTHGYFVPFPVSRASRGQYGGLSNSTIDIYDLTEKYGAVN